MIKKAIAPNYPIVIFDMDGLMIDSELIQSLSFKGVLKKYGIEVKEKIVQKLGVRVIENLELMKIKYGIEENVLTLFKEKNEIYDCLLKKKIRVMPGLFKLINSLKKANFNLALVSSSNLSHIETVLKKLKLEKYFNVIFSGDRVQKGKPNPEIYLKTARKLKADPKQCLVLEDTQTGVNAAKNAGMKCIAVPNQYTRTQDFVKADLIVDSLEKIDIKTVFQVMDDEYLDIVNDKDNWLGRDTRQNIHKSYQIHRGIHVFVFNNKKELLLQKRSEKKDYYPGFFDASVGAQVLATESYEDAAFREILEELGFKPKKLIKVCDDKSYSSRQRENRRLFICYFNGPFKINKNEIEFVKFYSIKTVLEEIERGEKQFTEGFKISFESYLKS